MAVHQDLEKYRGSHVSGIFDFQSIHFSVPLGKLLRYVHFYLSVSRFGQVLVFLAQRGPHAFSSSVAVRASAEPG